MHRIGVVLPHDADGGGEINRADGFREAVSGFDEVFVTEGSSVVRKSFAKAKKAALRSARSLIAKLTIADLRRVHPPRQLPRHAINVEFLMG